MAAKKSRAMKPSGNMTERVKQLNRWRDGFNPLRNLTIRRATSLLESYSLGQFTDLMWTFGHPSLGIEVLDADLSALITRRSAAIQKLDWAIKCKPVDTEGFDEALAKRQEARLLEVYEGIDNLPEAIGHLCLSTFRGFSIAEKWVNSDGDVYHLELVDHWHVVRDGACGRWKYNPDSAPTTFQALPGDPLPEDQFLIRTSPRPINMLGILKYVRGNLCEKNWDAFIEIYGVPGGVVVMPPNVPADREDEYRDAATSIAEGGSGALPHGSEYKTNDSPRGVQPFKDRLSHLSEKLILVGTGGKLTMLSSPTGIGGGASEQHEDVFDDIAQAEAAEISMLFQRGIDSQIYIKEFPGQPQLAYFEICAKEETDTSKFVQDVASLSQAGHKVDPEQITEKTGYRLIEVKAKDEPAPDEVPGNDPDSLLTDKLKNRTGGLLNSQAIAAEILGADAEWLAEARDIFDRISARAANGALTMDELVSYLDEAAERLPELLDENMVTALARPMERALAKGIIQGAREGLRKKSEVK